MKVKDLKIDLKPGTELTMAHELIGESGLIMFTKGQKVIVETVEIKEGFWGRGSGVWYDDELVGVTLEDHYGFLFPGAFEETQKAK
jgi:hypothetical protein